jgi:hypothetical protein
MINWNKMDKGTKWVVILAIILIFTIPTLIVCNILNDNNLSNILISLSAGLIGWLITERWANWLNRDKDDQLNNIVNDFREYSQSKFYPHCLRTDQAIDHIIKRNRIVVVDEERKNIGYKTLEPAFITAKKVKISGIACKDLIKELVEMPNHALLEVLRKNKGVRIDILINDPEAEHVKYRDLLEAKSSTDQKPCSNGIIESINKISELVEILKKSDKPLQNSVLQIRMTKIPLSNTLNYVEYFNPDINQTEQQMFVGFLFSHLQGTSSLIFEASEFDEKNIRNTLFKSALDSFEKVFEDCNGDESPTKNLLIWDYKGIKPKIIKP